MGKTTAHRLSATVAGLGRALRPRERAELETSLRAMLAWQHRLRSWKPARSAPDATPYVSLYANGVLRGCYGSGEGTPAERIARAFTSALADTRYGAIASDERATLSADVAYITHARPCRSDEAAAMIEAGTHGIARVDEGVATVLLPSVARERGYDAPGMIEILAKKAGRALSAEGLLWILDVEEVSSRGMHDEDGARAAKRFLEGLVAPDGSVTFEVDAGTGASKHEGVMRYGRIAVCVEALSALGSKRAKPARAWLEKEIARGLADRPDVILGTLALAARAGIETPLAAHAASVDASTCSPWHAAQAASVLGNDTPRALWDACLAGLEKHAFSPYLLMAAHLRADARVTERCIRAIADAIRKHAPYEGGAALTPIPETAMTSVAVESLSAFSTLEAKRAVRSARAFVAARQVLDVPAALHPRLLGAFRASPVAPIFRCDISAHAALALYAPKGRARPRSR